MPSVHKHQSKNTRFGRGQDFWASERRDSWVRTVSLCMGGPAAVDLPRGHQTVASLLSQNQTSIVGKDTSLPLERTWPVGRLSALGIPERQPTQACCLSVLYWAVAGIDSELFPHHDACLCTVSLGSLTCVLKLTVLNIHRGSVCLPKWKQCYEYVDSPTHSCPFLSSGILKCTADQ